MPIFGKGKRTDVRLTAGIEALDDISEGQGGKGALIESLAIIGDTSKAALRNAATFGCQNFMVKALHNLNNDAGATLIKQGKSVISIVHLWAMMDSKTAAISDAKSVRDKAPDITHYGLQYPKGKNTVPDGGDTNKFLGWVDQNRSSLPQGLKNLVDAYGRRFLAGTFLKQTDGPNKRITDLADKFDSLKSEFGKLEKATSGNLQAVHNLIKAAEERIERQAMHSKQMGRGVTVERHPTNHGNTVTKEELDKLTERINQNEAEFNRQFAEVAAKNKESFDTLTDSNLASQQAITTLQNTTHLQQRDILTLQRAFAEIALTRAHSLLLEQSFKLHFKLTEALSEAEDMGRDVMAAAGEALDKYTQTMKDYNSNAQLAVNCVKFGFSALAKIPVPPVPLIMNICGSSVNYVVKIADASEFKEDADRELKITTGDIDDAIEAAGEMFNENNEKQSITEKLKKFGENVVEMGKDVADRGALFQAGFEGLGRTKLELLSFFNNKTRTFKRNLRNEILSAMKAMLSERRIAAALIHSGKKTGATGITLGQFVATQIEEHVIKAIDKSWLSTTNTEIAINTQAMSDAIELCLYGAVAKSSGQQKKSMPDSLKARLKVLKVWKHTNNTDTEHVWPEGKVPFYDPTNPKHWGKGNGLRYLLLWLCIAKFAAKYSFDEGNATTANYKQYLELLTKCVEECHAVWLRTSKSRKENKKLTDAQRYDILRTEMAKVKVPLAASDVDGAD